MQKTDESKQAVKTPIKSYLPVLGIFIAGLAFSIIIFWFIHSWEKTNQRNEFDSWAKAYTNAIENTLDEYVSALLFLGDFFDNSINVTRQEFDGVVKSMLPRYPGIQAFGWNPLVKNNERSLYESTAKKDGYTDFKITERSETNQMVTAAQRDEYVIVYYMHPLGGNEAAFGFDLSSNETRLKAITKGFKTGKISATDRITLVQETGKQFGILLLQPVYEKGKPVNTAEERWKKRKGFVVEVLRVGQLIETAMHGFADEGINLSLYDMSAEKEKRFLYRNTADMLDEPELDQELQNDLYWSKTLHFAEREWKITFTPSEVYFQSRNTWQSWFFLIGSLLMTTLAIFYILKELQHSNEIEERVIKQTETNRQLESEIQERNKAETERDKTILSLQQALEEVKTLRGIIPLCSFCKKVRDDKGYWEQVDVYIHKHSQADISHGVCPDCMKEHYPRISQKS